MRPTLALTIGVFLVSSTAVAQNDFNRFVGSWVMDLGVSDTARADPAQRLRHVVMDIAHDEEKIRIQTTRDEEVITNQYRLRPPKTPVAAAGIDASFVHWEGEKLVTYTQSRINGMAVTLLERRQVSPDGAEMIVETMLTVQHGYQSGTNYSAPLRDVFRKSPTRP